jgi:uncharacterized protein (TIGR02757 family)
MQFDELKDFLEEKVNQYNTIHFIEADPVSIPHRYSKKEDIEIAGFLAATISWGNREQIVKNAHRLLDKFGESPHDFIMSYKPNHLKRFNRFVYRTFNEDDLLYFVRALRHVYTTQNGIEAIFNKHSTSEDTQFAIHAFRKHFLDLKHDVHVEKHIADPTKGSAAKRINMFLRWMVRKDKKGVDFGLWKSISPSALSCPLDFHSGNIARKLGLLTRNQNDSKAVLELDNNLRKMDKNDPVKYDFALFGLGIFDSF